MSEEPQLHMRVTHVSNETKHGIITAILVRSYGTQYAVTWEDLVERWHAAEELRKDIPANPHLGFISPQK